MSTLGILWIVLGIVVFVVVLHIIDRLLCCKTYNIKIGDSILKIKKGFVSAKVFVDEKLLDKALSPFAYGINRYKYEFSTKFGKDDVKIQVKKYSKPQIWINDKLQDLDIILIKNK